MSDSLKILAYIVLAYFLLKIAAENPELVKALYTEVDNTVSKSADKIERASEELSK